jgi:hypothetical protein
MTCTTGKQSRSEAFVCVSRKCGNPLCNQMANKPTTQMHA